MTLPTESEASTPANSSTYVRQRRVLFAGAILLGLLAALVVLVVPRLAAPIGTGAGVVAVAVPLVQWMCRDGRSRGGGGGDM
jgi:type IV secretory pathway TrbD component